MNFGGGLEGCDASRMSFVGAEQHSSFTGQSVYRLSEERLQSRFILLQESAPFQSDVSGRCPFGYGTLPGEAREVGEVQVRTFGLFLE